MSESLKEKLCKIANIRPEKSILIDTCFAGYGHKSQYVRNLSYEPYKKKTFSVAREKDLDDIIFMDLNPILNRGNICSAEFSSEQGHICVYNSNQDLLKYYISSKLIIEPDSIRYSPQDLELILNFFSVPGNSFFSFPHPFVKSGILNQINANKRSEFKVNYNLAKKKLSSIKELIENYQNIYDNDFYFGISGDSFKKNTQYVKLIKEFAKDFGFKFLAGSNSHKIDNVGSSGIILLNQEDYNQKNLKEYLKMPYYTYQTFENGKEIEYLITDHSLNNIGSKTEMKIIKKRSNRNYKRRY